MRLLSGGSRVCPLVRAQRLLRSAVRHMLTPLLGSGVQGRGNILFWGHEFPHPCSQMGLGEQHQAEQSRARPHLWMGQPTLSYRHTGESPDPLSWAWGDKLSNRGTGCTGWVLPTEPTGLSRDPAHCPSLKVTSGSGCHSGATARLWPQVLHQPCRGPQAPRGSPLPAAAIRTKAGPHSKLTLCSRHSCTC